MFGTDNQIDPLHFQFPEHGKGSKNSPIEHTSSGHRIQTDINDLNSWDEGFENGYKIINFILI